MKKLLLLFLLMPFMFISCSSDDDNNDDDIPDYTTIINNTYICKDRFASNPSKVKWIIYKINSDGSIKIEERENTVNGNIYSNKIGHFEYYHPNLKLKIQSIDDCDNCFNNFEAEVSENRRIISYQIYDITSGGNRILKFHVFDDFFALD